MIRKYIILLLLFQICLLTKAQTIGKYKYENKEYFIYPYRISNSDGIPMMGYKIPDGEYIVFGTYDFKPKFSLRRKKKYVLDDTSVVMAIVNIKSNVAEGPATFFERNEGRHRASKKSIYAIISGNLSNGLKEGVWKHAYPDDGYYETTTYHKGLRNGYEYVYTIKGTLISSSKFCNDSPCDTVFSYYNGKLYKEYDVLAPSEYKEDRSIYMHGLQSLNSVNFKEIRSYYREYDDSGKVKLYLHFNNGLANAYDSVAYITPRDTNYVCIHKNGNYQILKTYDSDAFHTKIHEYTYDKNYIIRTVKVNVSKYYTKKLFKKRKYVVQSVRTENTALNPDLIDMSSTQPVLISSNYNVYDTTEIYYVPKLRFAYTNRNPRQFLLADTTTHRIQLSEKIHRGKNYYTLNRYLYTQNKYRLLLDANFNPYEFKSYITGYQIYHPFKTCDYTSHITDAVDIESFCEQLIFSTYSNNDTLLNGNYILSESKRTKTGVPGYTCLTRFSDRADHSMGNFVDGKKNGTWQNLNLKEKPKFTPVDFKTYFFAHPMQADGYYELTYKNGYLNGPCTFYKRYVTRTKNNKIRKENITLYKNLDISFTNDTLNGVYKEYHYNGSLATDCKYVMGHPHGDYRQYFQNGNPKMLIQFDMGKLEGRFEQYTEDALACSANFKNNLLNDSLIYYYKNKKPMLCILAKDDTLKKRSFYFNSGLLKEETVFTQSSECTISKELLASESLIELLQRYSGSNFRSASGHFKNYYENGQLLSEGEIVNGRLHGLWQFYTINGIAIHEVNFCDTMIVLPGQNDSVEVEGIYAGFYNNGKKRCNGYIRDMDLSYDCFTKQDKATLDFYILDFYEMNGRQTVKNGSGFFHHLDSDGNLLSTGKLKNCKEDSLWKYYAPDQKLTEIGYYVNAKKHGVWYEGDLEGINFEDGACFDMEDPSEKKAFIEKQKELVIRQILYENGIQVTSNTFESNLNKTYKRRRRGHHVSF